MVYSNLEWEEIIWGNSSILLKGERRIEGLRSFKYYKKEKETKWLGSQVLNLENMK